MTTATGKPRTLILDCNVFELTTLALSLKNLGVEVVGQASDISSAQLQFRSESPDVVLFNLNGCDQSCLDLLQQLRELNPQLGIVLLTDSPDLRLYGIKESDLPKGSQLVEKLALHDLNEICEAIDLSISQSAKTGWVANEWDSKLGSLTNVQVETLRLLAMGLSNSDIGKARFVSEKSVEQTITRIGQSLQVVHERGRNMRVTLAAEYFKWLGSPREHAM